MKVVMEKVESNLSFSGLTIRKVTKWTVETGYTVYSGV